MIKEFFLEPWNKVINFFGDLNAHYADKRYNEEQTEYAHDIVFLSDRCELADIEEHTLYSQLEAVKNGRVIIVESIYFERPTARITKLLDYIKDSIEALGKADEETSSEEQSETESQDDEDTAESEEEGYYDDGYYE